MSLPRRVSENPVVGPRASGFMTGKDGEAGDIGVYRRYSRTQSSRKTSRSKPDRILRQAPSDKPNRLLNLPLRARGFTLIELLVVIAVISVLMGILVPALHKVRFRVYETTCLSNLRQINLALASYGSDDDRNRYPLELTEHNSHRHLLEKLNAYRDEALLEAFYCPQAKFLEQFANDPNGGVPTGGIDSVIDTPANREAGNITYLYWSFMRNKAEADGGTWRDPVYFLPRQLTLHGLIARREWLGETTKMDAQELRYHQCTHANPAEVWVVSDFFRKKGVFPHGRQAGSTEGGVNVIFLDGHAGRVFKSPYDAYR